MRGKDSVINDDFYHVYQISSDGGLIFYNVVDCLVYFTIACVQAEKCGVRPVAMVIMRNHLHGGYRTDSLRRLQKYIDVTTSLYSRVSNLRNGCKTYFSESFGRDKKVYHKDRQNCLIYIANNPVEKLACRRAVEYRWNFLAYYRNDHPFSSPSLAKKSVELLRAMSVVRSLQGKRSYLGYDFFSAVMPKLSLDEKAFLVDYIIDVYSVIDYDSAIHEFESAESMIAAINSMSGAEYNVGEVFAKEDYRHYSEMCSWARDKGLFGDQFQLLLPSGDSLDQLIKDCFYSTHASAIELSRFFHVDKDTVQFITTGYIKPKF